MENRLFSIVLTSTLAAMALSCDYDVPVQPIEELKPMGVVQGNLVYSGPAPCTENGHVVGAAVLYLFRSDGLPPPDGLSPSVENLTTVAGDALFHDLIPQLPFNQDGSLACPGPDTQPVTVSYSFTISPVSAGSYQIRSFYDYDGDYFPSFSYSNLATKGDIKGGALKNTREFLNGATPVYSTIIVGNPDGHGGFAMPDTGVHLTNVDVTLGQPYRMQRPYAYYGDVIDKVYHGKDPSHVVMPADYWAPDFSMTPTMGDEGNLVIPLEQSLLRVKFYPGVPELEKQRAMGKPFFLHVDDPGKLMLSRYDSNGDGVIDEHDGVPETELVPALMPMVIWTKTKDEDPTHSSTQSDPSVVIMGLTLDKDVMTTLGFKATEPQPRDEITVGVRPAVICIDSSSTPAQVTLVSPHEKDQKGGYVLGQDTTALRTALAGMLGTVPENVDVVYTCMPKGHYGVNLIYPSGQVWSLPNETGYCMPREKPRMLDGNGNPTMCGSRPRLASQGVTLEIGPPDGDVEYCYQFESEEKRERFRNTCLTAAERVKFDAHTLY